jgi:hypothetical protein
MVRPFYDKIDETVLLISRRLSMIRYVGATVIVCVITLNGHAKNLIDPNGARSLEHQLKSIAAKDKGEGTDVKKLENECLALLNKHNSPEEKGKIYSKIAIMYAGKGFSSPNDKRIQKTAQYCKKALEQPLDPVTAAEIYSRLVESQLAYKMTYGSSCPEQEFVKARQEAIINCLTGLKIVLDNNAPADQPGPPMASGSFFTFSGDNPNDPAYKKDMEEHRKKNQQSQAARQKWNSDQELYFLRQSLMGQCVTLYSHKPYNTSELERYARDMLKGHDDAIDEIIAKVNERIKQQGNK